MVGKAKIEKLKKVLVDFALDKQLISGHQDYTRFVILGGVRTGSNYLASLLRSHKNIIIHGELFKPDPDTLEWIDWKYAAYPQSPKALFLRSERPLEFLNSMVYKLMPVSIAAVGFKLFYFHAQGEKQERIWDYLRELKVKAIHIKRKNALARIVSVKIAKKTGEWSTNAENSAAARENVILDYKECLEFFETSERRWRDYDSYFNETLEIFYEDLVENYHRQMAMIQQFLNLPLRSTSSALKKQVKRPLSQVISNYQQLKEKFSGTQWEHFFIE